MNSDDRSDAYDRSYYDDQNLSGDRLALWYYARVFSRLCGGATRVLDFGCGTGHLLKRLPQGFEAFGYDHSAAARALCRENAPDATILEDWASIPAGHLGGIVTLHTLEHIEHPLSTVSDLVRRLGPGGVFLAVVPNTASPGRRYKGEEWFALRDPTHCSLLSSGEWVTVLRKAGLELDWLRGDGMWDAPYLPLVPTGVQRAIFGLPAALQVLSPIARPMLPPSMGECLILAAHKRGSD